MKDQELLGILARRVGGVYISDLHTRPYLARALRAALETEPGAFPLVQWQDAVNYLLDWRTPLQNEAEARSLLQRKAAELRDAP